MWIGALVFALGSLAFAILALFVMMLFFQREWYSYFHTNSDVWRVTRSILTALPPAAMIGAIAGNIAHRSFVTGRAYYLFFYAFCLATMSALIMVGENLFGAIGVPMVIILLVQATRSVIQNQPVMTIARGWRMISMGVLALSLIAWAVQLCVVGSGSLHDELAACVACALWFDASVLAYAMSCFLKQNRLARTRPFRLQFSLSALLKIVLCLGAYFAMVVVLFP